MNIIIIPPPTPPILFCISHTHLLPPFHPVHLIQDTMTVIMETRLDHRVIMRCNSWFERIGMDRRLNDDEVTS